MICRWCTEFVHKPDAWDADRSRCMDMGRYTDDNGVLWSFRYHRKSLSQVLLATHEQDEWPWRWAIRVSDGQAFDGEGVLYFHRSRGAESWAMIELDSRIQQYNNEQWGAALAACEEDA